MNGKLLGTLKYNGFPKAFCITISAFSEDSAAQVAAGQCQLRKSEMQWQNSYFLVGKNRPKN